MLETLRQPWPWYVSGAVIAFIMVMLFVFGKSFGISSSFRTICAACGAGKKYSFFDFDWRGQTWNLLFLVGAIIGGYISMKYLTATDAVNIAEATKQDLAALGFSAPQSIQPPELFGTEALFSVKTILLLIGGGLLVGFGTRYAGGCTSGHAITGLSTLQLPSLIAVIGFFIGGLIMTHLLFPFIF